jgi:nucleoid-associated protein YgaU
MSILLVGATLALVVRRNTVEVARPDLLAAAQRFVSPATGRNPPVVPQRIEQNSASPPRRLAEPTATSPAPSPVQPTETSRQPARVAQPSPPVVPPAVVRPSACPTDVATSAHRVTGRSIRHRVADGDTLARLAHRYLGSADRQEEIFAANRDVLTEPDLLPIGVVLKIPVPDEIGP